MNTTIKVETAGARLDKYLSGLFPDYSRTHIQKLIDEGFIKVDGRQAKSGRKLEVGDEIQLNIPQPQPGQIAPEAVPLKIEYENDDLLVIDKPAGLTTHPSPGRTTNTLINALIFYYPELSKMSDSLRPGIVHRLDKDTSGLIIIAKNERSRLNLVNQFKNRTVEKTYITLVNGHMTPEQGIIEAPIGRNLVDRKKMAVTAAGRPARSRFKVIKYFKGYSLLEVKPETGRTHQIRVHLAAVGFPVAGDAGYGIKSPLLKRQFLHAYRIRFQLPLTAQWVELKSELPGDLESFLKSLKADS